MLRFHQFALAQLSGGCQKLQKFYELIEKLTMRAWARTRARPSPEQNCDELSCAHCGVKVKLIKRRCQITTTTTNTAAVATTKFFMSGQTVWGQNIRAWSLAKHKEKLKSCSHSARQLSSQVGNRVPLLRKGPPFGPLARHTIYAEIQRDNQPLVSLFYQPNCVCCSS